MTAAAETLRPAECPPPHAASPRQVRNLHITASQAPPPTPSTGIKAHIGDVAHAIKRVITAKGNGQGITAR
ncbi:hypothetical protein BZB76_6365 [Actinomadura pelletieri DSM 43383]|uniref:Uncharacterized protein n=1 Tax=Actinomadura pelletieri DSM 43383 TaxID=1120940 RepID=A0A495Q9V6_9ACTN|nr:hypothetical protein [Actinomadura pelletieri]RKS68121.1 hypothetical protein BZB76_6365 [Actinomadura pelletieri DSM 43383]